MSLRPGSTRPPVHASVHLQYRSRDAGAQLNITQMAVATAEDHSLDAAEDVHRAGRALRVRHCTDTWPQAQLSTTVGETLVVMTSETLTADDLIELATRLQPASPTPPRI